MPVVLTAPEPALPTRVEWPPGEPIANSEALAYTALFAAWGAADPGGERCRRAEGMGLRCKSGRGGLEEVRKANRPAVFRLRDTQGRNFFATLLALDDKRARFTVGTQTTTIALESLADQWSGEYTLLWRGPPGKSEAIRSGARGPAVQWLAGALAGASGQSLAPSDANVFDAALMQQVRAFQLAQGLLPDGAVGPQTMIRLSALADAAAPSLALP